MVAERLGAAFRLPVLKVPHHKGTEGPGRDSCELHIRPDNCIKTSHEHAHWIWRDLMELRSQCQDFSMVVGEYNDNCETLQYLKCVRDGCLQCFLSINPSRQSCSVLPRSWWDENRASFETGDNNSFFGIVGSTMQRFFACKRTLTI